MTVIVELFDFGLCPVHPRRIAALKALSFAPTTSNDVLATLYEIVFGILDKVCMLFIPLIFCLKTVCKKHEYLKFDVCDQEHPVDYVMFSGRSI